MALGTNPRKRAAAARLPSLATALSIYNCRQKVFETLNFSFIDFARNHQLVAIKLYINSATLNFY